MFGLINSIYHMLTIEFKVDFVVVLSMKPFYSTCRKLQASATSGLDSPCWCIILAIRNEPCSSLRQKAAPNKFWFVKIAVSMLHLIRVSLPALERCLPPRWFILFHIGLWWTQKTDFLFLPMIEGWPKYFPVPMLSITLRPEMMRCLRFG